MEGKRTEQEDFFLIDTTRSAVTAAEWTKEIDQRLRSAILRDIETIWEKGEGWDYW